MIHPNFNPYTVRDGIAFIELTQNQTTMIDADDLPLVQPYRWHAKKTDTRRTYYVRAKAGGGKVIYMHRLLLLCLEGFTPDHISRDGLDNRRVNLRMATYTEQSSNQGLKKTNTSGHRGVCFEKRSQKWVVQARLKGKVYYLGSHAKLEDAVASRLKFDKAHGIPPA